MLSDAPLDVLSRYLALIEYYNLPFAYAAGWSQGESLSVSGNTAGTHESRNVQCYVLFAVNMTGVR